MKKLLLTFSVICLCPLWGMETPLPQVLPQVPQVPAGSVTASGDMKPWQAFALIGSTVGMVALAKWGDKLEPCVVNAVQACNKYCTAHQDMIFPVASCVVGGAAACGSAVAVYSAFSQPEVWAQPLWRGTCSAARYSWDGTVWLAKAAWKNRKDMTLRCASGLAAVGLATYYGIPQWCFKKGHTWYKKIYYTVRRGRTQAEIEYLKDCREFAFTILKIIGGYIRLLESRKMTIDPDLLMKINRRLVLGDTPCFDKKDLVAPTDLSWILYEGGRVNGTQREKVSTLIPRPSCLKSFWLGIDTMGSNEQKVKLWLSCLNDGGEEFLKDIGGLWQYIVQARDSQVSTTQTPVAPKVNLMLSTIFGAIKTFDTYCKEELKIRGAKK